MKTFFNFSFLHKDKWISVNDAMPELYDIVIIATEKHISAGTFHGEYWWDSGYDSEAKGVNKVTHWMPLPKHPKK